MREDVEMSTIFWIFGGRRRFFWLDHKLAVGDFSDWMMSTILTFTYQWAAAHRLRNTALKRVLVFIIRFGCPQMMSRFRGRVHAYWNWGIVHKWRHFIMDNLWPSPTITLFSTKALVLLSQNLWPHPLRPWRRIWTTPNHLHT